MTRILLAGASGMVGREVLRQALADRRIDEVVAPARRPLSASAKLRNPQVDFDKLPADAAWWRVDAVICTLGTTIREAGSHAAFRKVDLDYPLAVARHALAHGASAFVLDLRKRRQCGFADLLFADQGRAGTLTERTRLPIACAWCGPACSAASANGDGRSNTPA